MKQWPILMKRRGIAYTVPKPFTAVPKSPSLSKIQLDGCRGRCDSSRSRWLLVSSIRLKITIMLIQWRVWTTIIGRWRHLSLPHSLKVFQLHLPSLRVSHQPLSLFQDLSQNPWPQHHYLRVSQNPWFKPRFCESVWFFNSSYVFSEVNRSPWLKNHFPRASLIS